ncbi:MAG: tRNA 2-selenouridine(34) synthase MnmH [Pseudomonadota bacterium]
MKDLPLIDDYRRLFIDDIPLLDVRAPVEYERGAFPQADNHPLINDAERHQIGIEYKQVGQDAAVELGEELVNDAVREQRIKAWQAFIEAHPGGALYCFRGGMRSKISQQWIEDATGIAYPRIAGGYKALRSFLLDELEAAAGEVNTIVIGGRTGAGKTLLLKQLHDTIDLEGLARHRGSAFGHYAIPQPTQIDFENALSIAMLKHRARGNPPLIIEDEGRNIGSVHMPQQLFDRFKAGQFIILEATLEERVDNTRKEYIDMALQEYQAIHGEQEGFVQWADYLLASLARIRKRLGDVRYNELHSRMQAAVEQQRRTAETLQHDAWIAALLSDYYDPMYDYQLAKKEKNIVFTGDAAALKAWLQQGDKKTLHSAKLTDALRD